MKEHRDPARGRFMVKLMKLQLEGCSLWGSVEGGLAARSGTHRVFSLGRGGQFTNRKHFYVSISGTLDQEMSQERGANFQGSCKLL